MNSPFIKLIQQVQHGANPQMIVEQMIQNNPRIAQQVNMLKGQNGSMSYKDLAINMMRQRGIDPDQVMAMFGNSSQYEKCYNRGTHHHLICTQCGKVTEFQNEGLKQAIEQTKLTRFCQSHYSLYIYGICAKCERANRKEAKSAANKKGKTLKKETSSDK